MDKRMLLWMHARHKMVPLESGYTHRWCRCPLPAPSCNDKNEGRCCSSSRAASQHVQGWNERAIALSPALGRLDGVRSRMPNSVDRARARARARGDGQ